MKIKKSNSNKSTKALIILIVAVLVVAAAYAAYAFTSNNTPDPSATNRSESKTETHTSSSSKGNEQPSDTDDKLTENNSDTPIPPKTDPTTSLRNVSMTASADKRDGMLYIRGGINNSVEYAGSCYATLTGPTGKTIQKDTELLQNASTTDCKTIQISTNELSSGTWNITLTFKSDQATGTSNAYAIQI